MLERLTELMSGLLMANILTALVGAIFGYAVRQAGDRTDLEDVEEHRALEAECGKIELQAAAAERDRARRCIKALNWQMMASPR